MSLGKSQKQQRNLKSKLYKKKQEDKKKQEKDEFIEQISKLDDNKSYRIQYGGKYLMNGILCNGKYWKILYGIIDF